MLALGDTEGEADIEADGEMLALGLTDMEAEGLAEGLAL